MSETVRIGLNVYLDVTPRPGQTPEEAGDELAQNLAKYFTDPDGALFEDFGAYPEDIENWREDPDAEPPSWGGYEGPFHTHVTVFRQDTPEQQPVPLAESNY